MYYDPTQQMPVDILAFRPNSGDSNGISVVRKKFTNLPQDALVGVEQDKYHLAELPVALFESLELAVVEDAQPNCTGHACVPKLSKTNYEIKSLKAGLKAKTKTLAVEAGKNMVFLPPTEQS